MRAIERMLTLMSSNLVGVEPEEADSYQTYTEECYLREQIATLSMIEAL